jgi:hypothetical protein
MFRPRSALFLNAPLLVLGPISLAAVIAWLGASQGELVGDRLTRGTVRLALSWYTAGAGLMLFLDRQDWSASTNRGRLARWCWTWAWAAYIVHLGMAFHYFHGWSHAEAVEHVRRVSGFGPGIYFSHLFTLVWTADVITWWLWPARYADRNPWFDRLLHGFMLFMIFNGTIVYETGFIRWAGSALFVVLGGLWIAAQLRREQHNRDPSAGIDMPSSA